MNAENMQELGRISHARFTAEILLAVQSAQSEIGHSKEQVFNWLDDLAAGNKRPVPRPDVFPGSRK